MSIKKIECPTDSHLEQVSGTNNWYYAAKRTGDLYEAEEILQMGHNFEGTSLVLIHFPSGRILEPFPKEENIYIERPVWDNGKIALLRVDFNTKEIMIIHVETERGTHEIIARMPLACVKDCYNLKITQSPLTLYRQGGEGYFELIWPERVSIELAPRECYNHRDGDKLYFSQWHEDPYYRETIIVRASHNGEILETFSGMLYDMPDGSKWLI